MVRSKRKIQKQIAKTPRDLLVQHKKPFIALLILVFATVGVVFTNNSFANVPTEVGKQRIVGLTLPANVVSVVDQTSTNGRAALAEGAGTITGGVYSYGTVAVVKLRAKANNCAGSTLVTLRVSDQPILSSVAINGDWNEYAATVGLGSGKLPLTIDFVNNSTDAACIRAVYLDAVTLNGSFTPPQLTFSVSPQVIDYGARPTLTWSGSGVNSCVASGAWSGVKYANGTYSVSADTVTQNSEYVLKCRGYGGSVTKIASVSVRQSPITVGARETIKTRAQLKTLGLTTWPDGTSGVMKSGSSYTFYSPHSATSSKTIIRATGSLTNPTATIKTITPRSLKSNYDYYSGGPVYRDPATGTMVMITHTERGVSGGVWSSLAMARSTDGGSTWTDLGEIITPRLPITSVPSVAQSVDVGGGSYVVVGDYFYVYFADRLDGNVSTLLSVARAKVSDVIAAARRSTPTKVAWSKYYNGSWTQPGLGGLSSPLENANRTSADFPTVSYNSYLKKYIMIVSADWPKTNLHMLESTDGLNWGNRRILESESGESYYSTIVGTGTNPSITDKQFYVYYTYSALGGEQRWTDAVLARRLITLP